MKAMIERYTPISRFLYEDEYLFYDLDQSGSGFEFLFLMAGILIAAGVLTAVVLGYKAWRRRRLCDPRRDHYRDDR